MTVRVIYPCGTKYYSPYSRWQALTNVVQEIARYFRGKNFMNAPWLFAEAYKYRRLRECFSVSKHWKEYDVFFRQKCDTFARSSEAVFELSTRFAAPFTQAEGLSPEDVEKGRRAIFLELTQVCLWGNSTDLSLLINVRACSRKSFSSITSLNLPEQMTEEDIKKLQSTGGDHLAATEKNILGNDLEKLWDVVSKLKGGRVDFVLDNAGFELYCDMVYGARAAHAFSCVCFHADEQVQNSRLSHPIWACVKSALSWETNPLVRVGCDSQGLGLAHSFMPIHPPVSLYSHHSHHLLIRSPASPARAKQTWPRSASSASAGSRTNAQANGSTNNIPFGAQATHSGTSQPKRPTSSSTSPNPSSSFSKAT